jgi:hypothetical protein
MQSTIVGVDDVVGDEDDDASDKVVVDEGIEGKGTGNVPEGSCWTTIIGVVGGTCVGQKWPCRLPVVMLKVGEEEPGGVTMTLHRR